MENKQLNVLLADDDQDDRIFFDQALKELPIRTSLTTVKDGFELMGLLSDETVKIPDVLFLDINMPRKNGFECLSEIKLNSRLINMPVVMFSTSNSLDDIRALFKTGSNVYIHKPNDFSKLKEVIYHALPLATEKEFSNTPVKYILNA